MEALIIHTNSPQLKSDLHENSWIVPLIYLTVLSWGILAILFSFLDLQISFALVNSSSRWARWVEEYGEVPGAVMVIIALFIYDRLRTPSGLKEALLRSFGISILVSFLIFHYGSSFFGKFEFYWCYTECLFLLGWGCVLVIHTLLKKVQRGFFQKKRSFAIITISLAILNPLLFVQSVKFIWGRVRFRDLAADYSNYSPWYLPQGITGNYSFPSGHTAMAWMLLPLLLLIQNKSRKVKLVVGSLIIIWGIFIALGRIVIGAHYASDVLFSTGVAIVSYLVLYKQHISQRISIENVN